jgi:hypothetical protein
MQLFYFQVVIDLEYSDLFLLEIYMKLPAARFLHSLDSTLCCKLDSRQQL